MESYICQHCGANLDRGDIFEHFMLEYNDRVKALASAAAYGWSETDRIHFTRAIIVQPDREPQYEICPDCKKKWPLAAMSVTATSVTATSVTATSVTATSVTGLPVLTATTTD